MTSKDFLQKFMDRHQSASGPEIQQNGDSSLPDHNEKMARQMEDYQKQLQLTTVQGQVSAPEEPTNVPDISRPASPGMMMVEEAIQQDLAAVPETPGRSPYQCARCGSGDHRVQLCPQRPSNPATPYQGDRLSLGKFICGQWPAGWPATLAHFGMACYGCGCQYECPVYSNSWVMCPSCGLANLPVVMLPLPQEVRSYPQHDQNGFFGQGNGAPF